MEYEGTLLGYAETGMSYIKDHIDLNFTILRPDCLSYPILGYPEFSTIKSISLQNFEYEIKLNIPNNLCAVNGGILTNKVTKKGYTTYTFKSSKPTYQMVTAIADYKKLETENISTYYFEKDSTEAKKVHRVLLNTFELYSKWWGKLNNKNTFSLIEIPDNYGSQATESYVIQTAAAFNNPDQLMQLYHEISHLWNVKSTNKYPSRWNEGLATFIQYKTVDKLENRNVLNTEIIKVYESIKKNKNYRKKAFINYGKENVTDRSYKTGFIFFYVLHNVVGENKFNQIIRTFYQKYSNSGATIKEFENLATKVSNRNLSNLFNDWFYTTNFYYNLKENIPISKIVESYNLN